MEPEACPRRETETFRLVVVKVAQPSCIAGIGSAAVLAAVAVFLDGRQATGVAARPKSVPAALQPFQAKAEAGDASAMRMLGLCYCYGMAAPADWPTGITWLRRAAKAGNTTARKELGSMGVSAD